MDFGKPCIFFSFTVIILPREEKKRKGHLQEGQAKACEYKYGLTLYAYTLSDMAVGENMLADCVANILTAWISKFKLMSEWQVI